jgi:NTE family protein
MEEKIPNFQRVLVLQGGGSLGAYEAGVYRAFYEKVTKMDKERGFNDKPLLDIVAGTSIGAINSAVLVIYVKHSGMQNVLYAYLLELA